MLHKASPGTCKRWQGAHRTFRPQLAHSHHTLQAEAERALQEERAHAAEATAALERQLAEARGAAAAAQAAATAEADSRAAAQTLTQRLRDQLAQLQASVFDVRTIGSGEASPPLVCAKVHRRSGKSRAERSGGSNVIHASRALAGCGACVLVGTVMSTGCLHQQDAKEQADAAIAQAEREKAAMAAASAAELEVIYVSHFAIASTPQHPIWAVSPWTLDLSTRNLSSV